MARILVVDDDEQVRSFVVKMLKIKQYNVEEAVNGEDAIRILTTEPGFDLVVSDVNMPKKSGMDVAREVCLRHPSTKILMMTGNTVNNQVLDFLEIEFPGIPVLGKPLRHKTLFEAVAEALGNSEEARD